MKSELLPNLDGEDLSVTTMYPNPDYFQGWDKAKQDKIKEINQNITENADVVGLTHTDADGYGCEIMLRKAFEESNVQVITASETGPHSIQQIGECFVDNISSNAKVFIMDLAPDDGEGRKFIDPFRNHNADVKVVDHHEWSENDYEQIEWVADVYHNTDKCATQIMYDEFVSDTDDYLSDLAELTADHDLWIKEDEERSDSLSDLAYGSDRETYVDLGLEYGVEMIDVEEGLEIINEREEIRNKKTDIALNRVTSYEINSYKVAITYGECSASNVGDVLYNEKDYDLACVIYPNGNVSLRSSEDSPVAREVAIALGGNGHECAAGGSIDIVGNSVNYTTHWATLGRAARQKLVEIIKNTL